VKILNIEFNKNNFKITFCYGLDEVIHENLKSYKVYGVQIPGILPPKLDFHSKFFRKEVKNDEDKKKLILPEKHKVLLELFKSPDAIVKFMYNRQEVCTFSKLKNCVQSKKK
jgi:hypothetical protein